MKWLKKLFGPSINSQLISAAETGTLADVTRLLAEGASKEAMNQYGWTVLQCAAGRGQLHVVKCLLAAGANIEGKHKNGVDTALSYAAMRGQADVFEHLLAAGATKTKRDL